MKIKKRIEKETKFSVAKEGESKGYQAGECPDYEYLLDNGVSVFCVLQGTTQNDRVIYEITRNDGEVIEGIGTDTFVCQTMNGVIETLNKIL